MLLSVAHPVNGVPIETRQKRKRVTETRESAEIAAEWKRETGPLSNKATFTDASAVSTHPLFPWQRRAFDRAVVEFSKQGGSRLAVCATAGTGKSTLGALLLATFQCECPSLVLVPSTLIEQWTAELCKYGRPPTLLKLETKPSGMKGALFICSMDSFIYRLHGPVEWGMVVVDERQRSGVKFSDALANLPTKRFIMMAAEAPLAQPIGQLLIPIERIMQERVIYGEQVPLPALSEYTVRVAVPARGSTPTTRGEAEKISSSWLPYKLPALNSIVAEIPAGEKMLFVIPSGLLPSVCKWVFVRIDGRIRVGIMASADTTFAPPGVLLLSDKRHVITDAKIIGEPDIPPDTAPDYVFPFVSQQMTIAARNAILNTFMENGERVCIVSHAAIAFGLNLQRVSHMVYAAPVFDKEARIQLDGRIVRPGSYTNHVKIWHLVADGTFEEAPVLYYSYAPQRLLANMAAAHKTDDE